MSQRVRPSLRTAGQHGCPRNIPARDVGETPKVLTGIRFSSAERHSIEGIALTTCLLTVTDL